METRKNVIKEQSGSLSQKEIVDKFLQFCQDILGYKVPVTVKLVTDRSKLMTLASYNLNDNTVNVYSKNRATADILRSIAHELVHHKQLEDGRIDINNPPQDIGGVIEDEANAIAGQLVKGFGYTGINIYENTNKKIKLPKMNIVITEQQLHRILESKKFDRETTLSLYDGMDKGRKDMRSKVREMQEYLISLNYVLPRFGVDGKFGPETLKAVNAFQADHGFEVSDKVDEETLRAMKNLKNINKNPKINDPKQIKTQFTKGNVKSFSPVVVDAINVSSDENGLSKELMFTIANIESGGDPSAKNKNSGASGLYQIMPKYFDDYGVTNLTVWDPYENAKAAGKKLKEKIRSLSYITGRRPTNAEIYMAHNQGTRGFEIIYTACQNFGNLGGKESLEQASNKLGYGRNYGKGIFKNMKANNGTHPCQFMELWTEKYDNKKINYS